MLLSFDCFFVVAGSGVSFFSEFANLGGGVRLGGAQSDFDCRPHQLAFISLYKY